MTRRTIDVAHEAERDIRSIHRAGQHTFGDVAADRYGDLILAGILTLADEPAQKSAKTHGDLRGAACTYHLRHGRQTATPKVRTPRHFLVYTYDVENLRVLRVLHDAMDLPRHLPPDT